ncbi:hypothetical protein K502DRAFT_367783 [Neoconidiobolus thromboides FSU 785]|nr:hypothetical protein K502DRAFT_367783 [Neoconidiobolus thromboides FSU 785]
MEYQNNFWPLNNNFSLIVKRLDQRISQSYNENSQILQFLQNRKAIEDLYSVSLVDLAGIKKSAHPNSSLVIDNEEGASLPLAFDALKESYIKKGQQHYELSSNLQNLVINPLERVFLEYKQAVISYKKPILEKINELEECLNRVSLAKKQYFEKCSIADELEEQAILKANLEEEENKEIPKKGQVYLLGALTLNEKEMQNFLIKIQTEVNISLESKSKFLGFFRGLITGDDITKWLLMEFKNVLLTPNDAVNVGQALIDLGYLRLIGPGNKFHASNTTFYQWKKKATEVEDLLNDQNLHNDARVIATEADIFYKELCFKTDKLRLQVEQLMYKFLNLLEKNEESRIESIKAAFVSLASIETNNENNFSSIANELFLHLETLKPKQDILLVVESYRTGPFQPCPILYVNYYYGEGIDQNFGVNLDIQAKVSRSTIPATFSLLMDAIIEEFKTKDNEECLKFWCSNVPLKQIHKLRNKLNKGKISPSSLPKLNIELLISTLKLYLLELADSLISMNYYDKLKQIYLINDNDLRLNELSIIINELSIPNYLILKSLINQLKNIINESFINNIKYQSLFQSIIPCILRPPPALRMQYYYQRYPLKLIKDLILNFNLIFEKQMNPKLLLPYLEPQNLPEQELIDFTQDRMIMSEEVQSGEMIELNNIRFDNEEENEEEFVMHHPIKANNENDKEEEKNNNNNSEVKKEKSEDKKEIQEEKTMNKIKEESNKSNNKDKKEEEKLNINNMELKEEDYLDLDLVDFDNTNNNSNDDTGIIDLNDPFIDIE